MAVARGSCTVLLSGSVTTRDRHIVSSLVKSAWQRYINRRMAVARCSCTVLLSGSVTTRDRPFPSFLAKMLGDVGEYVHQPNSSAASFLFFFCDKTGTFSSFYGV